MSEATRDEALKGTTGSLFDQEQEWRERPSIAFDTLLQSPEYHATSLRAPKEQGDAQTSPRRISAQSMPVFRSMFQRYVEHLKTSTSQRWRAVHAGLDKSIVDAEVQDVEAFMRSALSSASRETLKKYLRLIQRVHQHLVERKLRPDNPVTAWLAGLGQADTLLALLEQRNSPKTPSVNPQTVRGLRRWLADEADREMNGGDWERARDLVMALLALNTGMRSAELILLGRSQLADWSGIREAARRSIEITVPVSASAPTVLNHRVFVEGRCARLLADWLLMRWPVRAEAGVQPGCIEGEKVFVDPRSKARGKTLAAWKLFTRLKDEAERAASAGCLQHDERWIMATGAQGLRRAYALDYLSSGGDRELLTERLGHWRHDSLKHYDAALRQASAGIVAKRRRT